MSKLTELVDILEIRLGKLLQRHQALEGEYGKLQQEINISREENRLLQESLENSERTVQTLKAANALLGSNEYKKETKLRLNSLIREIDQCIVQLSE